VAALRPLPPRRARDELRPGQRLGAGGRALTRSGVSLGRPISRRQKRGSTTTSRPLGREDRCSASKRIRLWRLTAASRRYRKIRAGTRDQANRCAPQSVDACHLDGPNGNWGSQAKCVTGRCRTSPGQSDVDVLVVEATSPAMGSRVGSQSPTPMRCAGVRSRRSARSSRRWSTPCMGTGSRCRSQ